MIKSINTMDLSKETKLTLATKLEEAQSSLTNVAQANQNHINIANYFNGKLLVIEKNLNDSLPKKQGFIPTALWIISNAGTIVKLIKTIIAQIKEWRSEVDKIIEAQKANQPVEQAPQ